MNANNAKSVHSAHPCASPFGQQSCAKWLSCHFGKGELNLKTKAA